MAFWNKYPFTDFHELNLDWILEKIMELNDKVLQMYKNWNDWVIETTPLIKDTINNWLDTHPEATTTVLDGSLTYNKMVTGTMGFVTPKMFGAFGNGVTDDTEAWQRMLDFGGAVLCDKNSTYLITDVLRIKKGTSIDLNGCTIKCNQGRWLFNFLDEDRFESYNGNGDIYIHDGTVEGGSVSFWHGKNICFENVQFKDCLNDHFFEICACKDFTIKDCSFVGMYFRSGSVHEYINIDPCTNSISSYFTGSEYPAVNYDGTKNENIFILNNYFNINESDTNFQAHDNPFGCHAPIGNYHKNVQFIGNTCYNFKQCALRISDFENAIIRDNFFESSICQDTAIIMIASGSMTYSNINCVVENNTIRTLKWGVGFSKSNGLTFRYNSYENLDFANHSLGTLAENNKDFSFYGNVKNKNSSPDMLSLDSGDYTSQSASPFDILQFTRIPTNARTISGNTVTLNTLRWSFFDKIYIQFTNSPKIYEVDAWSGYFFAGGNNYPVVTSPYTGDSLIWIRIDSTDLNKMTLNFADGTTNLTVQTIYVEKSIGTRP